MHRTTSTNLMEVMEKRMEALMDSQLLDSSNRRWLGFSRMRRKGRVTGGVWGVKVCSLDFAFASATVRNRSQPFATVRNRSQVSA